MNIKAAERQRKLERRLKRAHNIDKLFNLGRFRDKSKTILGTSKNWY